MNHCSLCIDACRFLGTMNCRLTFIKLQRLLKNYVCPSFQNNDRNQKLAIFVSIKWCLLET